MREPDFTASIRAYLDDMRAPGTPRTKSAMHWRADAIDAELDWLVKHGHLKGKVKRSTDTAGRTGADKE